ncbi:MAG: hypothetical protein ACRDLS_14700 [Solirubrobacteraceae bacterium]
MLICARAPAISGREQALAALARDKHGVAPRPHLTALGFDRGAIRRMVSKAGS